MIEPLYIAIIGGGILAVGGLVTFLIYRKLHISSDESSSSPLYPGLASHREPTPTKTYDIEGLFKGSEDLRTLLFSNPEHEKTFHAIMHDQELLNGVRSAKNYEEARKILKDWLERHQKTSAKPADGDKNTRDKKEKIHENPSKKKEEKENLKKEMKSFQSTPIVLAPPSPSAVRAFKEFVTLLNGDDMSRIIAFITELPDNTIKALIEDHGRIQLEQSSPKANLIFAKAKTKNDVIISIKQEMVNKIKGQYEDLKEKISTLRKRGADVQHEDLMLAMIPPKIKAFSITLDKKELGKVTDSLSALSKELAHKEKSFEKGKD